MKYLLACVAFLSAAPVFAQTDEASCRAALAAYQKSPSVAALEPLFGCIDDSKPPLRALILDKIVCREVWNDPKFNKDVAKRLRAVVKKYDRGSAVFDPVKDTLENLEVNKFASGMGMWLDNWERDIDPEVVAAKRREEAAYQRRRDARDARIKFKLWEIALFGVLYLLSLARLTLRSRRLRTQTRRPNNLPPDVTVS